MNRYLVTWTVEVEAESPEEALTEAQDTASISGLVNDYDVIRVRQEPFNRPSPIWDMTGHGLRRKR